MMDERMKERIDAMLRDAQAVPPPVEAQLKARLAAFREHLDMRDRRRALVPLWWRLGTAVAGAAVVLILGAVFFASNPSPTWADVVERIDSVPFFNATVYFKAHATAEPVQVEVWMAQGGKLRLRAGNRVIFGDNGVLRETIWAGPGRELPRSVEQMQLMTADFLLRLRDVDAFCFDTLLNALPIHGTLSGPLHNQNATISDDLVVFDLASDSSPEWMRFWALRESRLPVRVVYWDPRNGQSIDISLSYANRQPPAFFDPEAFRAALARQKGGPSSVYLLQADPGGLAVTPEDVTQLRAVQKRSS